MLRTNAVMMPPTRAPIHQPAALPAVEKSRTRSFFTVSGA